MARMSNKDLKDTLKDIGLELQDEGFHYNVSNVESYTNTSYITIIIHNKGVKFNGSVVADVMERLFFFMKSERWYLWLEMDLYTGYKYQRDMKHACLQREYDYYFGTDKKPGLFRGDFERVGGCIESIKMRFEHWS